MLLNTHLALFNFPMRDTVDLQRSTAEYSLQKRKPSFSSVMMRLRGTPGGTDSFIYSQKSPLLMEVLTVAGCTMNRWTWLSFSLAG